MDEGSARKAPSAQLLDLAALGYSIQSQFFARFRAHAFQQVSNNGCQFILVPLRAREGCLGLAADRSRFDCALEGFAENGCYPAPGHVIQSDTLGDVQQDAWLRADINGRLWTLWGQDC